MTRPVQYIIVNEGLDMSPGKIAAQAGHAAVEGFMQDPDSRIAQVWRASGHYTKIVLSVPSSEKLRDVDRYITDRGFKTALIIDEGHTEIEPFSPTALGTQILDKDALQVKACFGEFPLFKQPRPSQLVPKEEVEKLLKKVEDFQHLLQLTYAEQGRWFSRMFKR